MNKYGAGLTTSLAVRKAFSWRARENRERKAIGNSFGKV